jgi:nucleoside-diphosphate-sugar epimerase
MVEAFIGGLPDVPALAQPDRERRIRCLLYPGSDPSALEAFGERVELIEGDLRNGESVSAFCRNAEGATLFHFAAVVHPTRGVREFYEVNVDGTRNLLRAAEDFGVSRVVVVSSNSPFGANPSRDHLFDELSPYKPYMNYGLSKMMKEQLVYEYQERGKLETVIVRAPWFYGPNQPPRQTLFFKMIKSGRVPIVGDGQNRRSMAYIDNVCQGVLLAMFSPVANGQTYWIADRRPYTMVEIISTIQSALEEFGIPVARKHVRLPNWLGGAAEQVDRILQGLGLYHQKIHVLSEMNKTIACSIDRACKDLSFEPTVGLREGMRRSVQWIIECGIPL